MSEPYVSTARYGATLLDVAGLRMTRDEAAFLREADPFALILFARNIDTPDQVYALASEFREAVGRDALVTIDQEGGRVQRLRGPQWTEFEPTLDFVQASGDEAERAVYLRHRLIAAELSALTIDSNCAPVLDIADDNTHPFLRNRCFGKRADDVAELGSAAARGLSDGGVVPVLKHFPGHGRARQDSHMELPHVDISLDELREHDFRPFQALNDQPIAMSAHIVFEAIDEAPATMSAEVMGLMRNEIDFKGLLMSDDLSMKAIEGTPAEKGARAIAAGLDVAMLCNAPLSDQIAFANAVGRMSDASQMRAEAAIESRKIPMELDIDAAKAELADIMKRAACN